MMNNYNKILYLIRKGKLDKLKELFTNDIDVNDTRGLFLRTACEYGHLDVVKFLIDKGAHINPYFKNKDDEESHYRDSPIFLAVKEGYSDIVKLLIEKGIGFGLDISYDTYQIVIDAAYYGRYEIFKFLIKDVDLFNNSNFVKSCLYEACSFTRPFESAKKEYLNIIEFLLNKGVDGDLAMNRAIRNKNLDLIKFLVSKGIKLKNTYLITAADYKGDDYLKIIKYFIENGLDPAITRNLTNHIDYFKLEAYLDQLKVSDNKQELIKKIENRIKNNPSIIYSVDAKEKLKMIPNIEHLIKSDEYGLFENKHSDLFDEINSLFENYKDNYDILKDKILLYKKQVNDKDFKKFLDFKLYEYCYKQGPFNNYYRNENDLELIKFLLDFGANPTGLANLVLIYATNDIKLLKFLHVYGNADLTISNPISHEKNDALKHAIIKGNLETTKYLLQNGCKLYNIKLHKIIKNNIIKNYILKYLKLDAWLDQTLNENDPIKNESKEQQIIKAIKIDPKLIDNIDKSELENIPEIEHLIKSNDYGLFERKILDFKKYIKQNKI